MKIMKFRKLFLSANIFILLAGGHSAFSAEDNSETKRETLRLTVQESVAQALENNISIKRQEITLDAAKRENKTSWNSVSPSLSLSGSYGKSNRDFDKNYSASITGSISATLSTNLYTDIKGAKLKYEKGELDYENAKRSVELSVRKTFYNLLFLKESIDLQKTNFDTAKQQYETNLRKYNQGAISQLDVLSSQVNYETQIPEMQEAQINYDSALADFKQTLGISQDKGLVLDGSLDEFIKIKYVSTEGVETYYSDLAVLEKNIEIAKNSLLANRFSAYGPTLKAGWTYSENWAKNASTGYTATGPTENGGLKLSVTIPLDGILPWSKGANNVASANDSIKDLNLQLEDKKTTLQVNTETGIKKIEKTISSIESLEASVRLAEKTYSMTQEAYNRGTRNYTELQTAGTSLEKARLNLKQQANNLAAAILDLENTLGLPFGSLINNEKPQGENK